MLTAGQPAPLSGGFAARRQRCLCLLRSSFEEAEALVTAGAKGLPPAPRGLAPGQEPLTPGPGPEKPQQKELEARAMGAAAEGIEMVRGVEGPGPLGLRPGQRDPSTRARLRAALPCAHVRPACPLPPEASLGGPLTRPCPPPALFASGAIDLPPEPLRAGQHFGVGIRGRGGRAGRGPCCP